MLRKELINADEAARLLNVTRRTLLRWAREKRIESIIISKKKILFSLEAVDEFLRSKTNTVKSRRMNLKGTGRIKTGPKSRKGGDGPRSRKSWRSLRKEVTTWR